MKIINPTFGSDFEVFTKVKDGEVIPCPSFFGGTKKKPLSIGENSFRQIDGVSAEFNTYISTNEDNFVESIAYCLRKGKTILGDNYDFEFKGSHEFNPKQFTEERHTEFGCEPSFLAWDNSDEYVANSNQAGNVRTTGFHIHVGFHTKEYSIEEVEQFIKLMDFYVGCSNVDTCYSRREIYGQPGEYRVKRNEDTGLTIIEYRCLSGEVLSSEQKIRDVFKLTKSAISAFNTGSGKELQYEDVYYKMLNKTQYVEA